MIDLADKAVVFLGSEIKTPPLSANARHEAGVKIRLLQGGHLLSMPHSRPMPSIGARCHELRINDEHATWRIIYRIDEDAIVIAEIFSKQTQQTPKAVIARCKRRLRAYDEE